MARGIRIPIVGDPDSVLRAINKTIAAGEHLGNEYKKIGAKAEDAAKLQIRASVEKDARLRKEIVVYRQIADTAEKGSREQVAAANLAAQAQGRLSRALTVSEHEQRKLQAGARATGRDFGKFSRGAIVGSGAARSLGRSMAFASSAFLGGAGITFAIRSFITEASTLQEETEKTGVVFGRNAKDVQRWSTTLANSFGVSTGAALQAAGVFGNMFHSLHVGESDAAVMSKRLVELAADMASFNNASPAETLEALQSGLAGQVRPLRQFGVFLSQDRIKQEALNSGIAKSAAHLTANQKVLAAYNIILKDTAVQHGDVARNTESLSVAESKLRAELENNEAAIGRKLLPTLVKYTNELADWLGKSKNQKKIQHDVDESLKVIGATFRVTANVIGTTADAVDRLNSAFDAIPGHSASLRDLFNKIPGHGPSGIDLFKSLFGSGGEHLDGRSQRPGLSPIGENALGNRPVASRTGAADSTSGRLGLLERFKKADLALAKAERTKIASDDRAALQVEAGILKAELESRKKVFRDKATITRQLKGVEDQIAAIDKQAADARKQAAEDKKRRAQERRAAVIQGLQINVDRAGLTKGLADDVKATAALLSTLKQQLRLDKNNLDIQSQIVATEGQFAGLREQQRLQASERRETRQFRALGLGAGGSTLAPTKRALKKELGKVEDSLKGTFLDTNATKSVLQKIRKVMSGQLGALSADVRSTVQQMLDDLKGQLGEFDGFNLTKAEKRRRFLDKQLSGPIGSGGGGRGSKRSGGTVVHVHQTIVAQKGESVDALARRLHFRARQAFAH